MEFYYFAWWVGDNESPVGVKLGLVPCALSQEHFLSTVTLGSSMLCLVFVLLILIT